MGANGPHNGQKYVGYNTERSEGEPTYFCPSELASEFMRLLGAFIDVARNTA